MKTIKCFEVLGNTDTTEGRGPMVVVARFSSYDVASKYVQSKAYSNWCVMGYQSSRDLNNIREVTITIVDSIDELDVMNRENLKARALSKLTPAEKSALGF